MKYNSTQEIRGGSIQQMQGPQEKGYNGSKDKWLRPWECNVMGYREGWGVLGRMESLFFNHFLKNKTKY